MPPGGLTGGKSISFIRLCLIKQKSVVDRVPSTTLFTNWRLPTLPLGLAVPSALMGLTSLFGMDRGGSPSLLPPLYFVRERLRVLFSQSYQTSRFEAFGILVLLGFVITDFTPAAYLRSSLLRPSWKSHLGASFALRCFQRLSLPYIDTRLCNWRHNR